MALPPGAVMSAALPGQELRESRRERGGALLEHLALEVEARAPMLGVIGRVEASDDGRGRRPDAHGERLARALVTQARDDQEEAGGVGLSPVREAGLVADELDG